LREELGDLLFHIVIQAQIAWEAEAFSLSDVLEGIDSKLKRRHPHVWGDLNLANSDEVLLNWERLKATEKKERGDNDSLLDHIPPELPALAQSQKIQTRVGQVGFDWDEIAGVHAKLVEELEELRVASTAQEQFDEIGDVFFALVNLARWLDLDAESAAREANMRFARRFRKVESLARQREIEISEANAASLLALWDEAKLA
jgi:tetrapyrrole methylase family protein/MazG family protein